MGSNSHYEPDLNAGKKQRDRSLEEKACTSAKTAIAASFQKNVASNYLLCDLNVMKWESLLILIANEPVFTSAFLLAGDVSARQVRLQLSR